ncbi:hypothetical protein C8J56DRAFT_941437 [Mycena floridula]|nr:hypothetical protein C8J56DRAFT_941437 [Mycena floridula]
MVNFISAFTLTLVTVNVALTVAAPLQLTEIVERDPGLLFAREHDDFPLLSRDLKARGGPFSLTLKDLFRKEHHKKVIPSTPGQDQQQQKQQRRQASDLEERDEVEFLEGRHVTEATEMLTKRSKAGKFFKGLFSKVKGIVGLRRDVQPTVERRSKAGKFFKGLFSKVKGVVGLRRDEQLETREVSEDLDARDFADDLKAREFDEESRKP